MLIDHNIWERFPAVRWLRSIFCFTVMCFFMVAFALAMIAVRLVALMLNFADLGAIEEKWKLAFAGPQTVPR